MKLSELISNSNEAKWHTFDEEGNIKFKIKPLDNDQYQIAFEKYRRHVNSQDHKTLNLDVSDNDMSEAQVQCKLFAKYIIVDWQGITDENGNDAPYNEDMAYQLLKGNTDVFLFVFKKANEDTKAVQENSENIKKKSETSSNTSLNTETKDQKSSKPSTKS